MGLGELGRLYAGAALRAGYRVTPITRGQSPADALSGLPEATPILLAVGEEARASALDSLPKTRVSQTIWLQNELFPRDWAAFSQAPTVLVPWLLQKRGKPLTVLHPSPVFGKHATLVSAIHQAIDLPAVPIEPEQGAAALRDKYAFILTMNALGLVKDAPLGWFLAQERALIDALLREAAELACRLCNVPAAYDHVAQLAVTAFGALRDISPRGRTALARVERALQHAAIEKLALPTLQSLHERTKGQPG